MRLHELVECTSGAVAAVATPMGSMQRRVKKKTDEAAPFPVRAAAGLGMGALSGSGGVIIGGMLGGLFAPIIGGYAGYHGAKMGMELADDIWDWAAKKLGGREQDAAMSHIRAAAAGKDTFEFNGKSYPVTLKKNQVHPAIQAVKQVAESKLA